MYRGKTTHCQTLESTSVSFRQILLDWHKTIGSHGLSTSWILNSINIITFKKDIDIELGIIVNTIVDQIIPLLTKESTDLNEQYWSTQLIQSKSLPVK